MPDPFDVARDDVQTLLSDVLSSDRFRKWAVSDRAAPLLDSYGFGEIFWRKSIGRPHTAKMSDGFAIEAWKDEIILVGSVGGAAHWEKLRDPYFPSWWDAKDDEDYWRISFMVPNLRNGKVIDGVHHEYSHVVPKLVDDVWWDIPGGKFGIGTHGRRVIEPAGATFLKEDEIPHLSFEVVLKSFLEFP